MADEVRGLFINRGILFSSKVSINFDIQNVVVALKAKMLDESENFLTVMLYDDNFSGSGQLTLLNKNRIIEIVPINDEVIPKKETQFDD